ncbi:MAG: hypothetical protein ABEJ24_05750 [Candidatus Magasanikbacteria bacterium]
MNKIRFISSAFIIIFGVVFLGAGCESVNNKGKSTTENENNGQVTQSNNTIEVISSGDALETIVLDEKAQIHPKGEMGLGINIMVETSNDPSSGGIVKMVNKSSKITYQLQEQVESGSDQDIANTVLKPGESLLLKLSKQETELYAKVKEGSVMAGSPFNIKFTSK